MTEQPLAHLVFLRHGLQDECDEYMTSFGPWSVAAICEYFSIEFGPADSRWLFRSK